MQYVRSFFRFFTSTDTRARATGLVLALLGMVVAGAYTLGKDIWIARDGADESEDVASDSQSSEEDAPPISNETSSAEFNTSGDRTVNVNSSQTGDIEMGDN